MDPLTLLLMAWLAIDAKKKPPVQAPRDRTPPPRKMPPPRPKPSLRPSNVQFPGPQWVPYDPPPELVQRSAKELIPILHDGPSKTAVLYHEELGKPVAYKAAKHGSKKAVEAFRLKSGTVLPSGWIDELKKGEGQKPKKKRVARKPVVKKKAPPKKAPVKKKAPPKKKAPAKKKAPVKRKKPPAPKSTKMPPKPKAAPKPTKLKVVKETPAAPAKDYSKMRVLMQGMSGKEVEKLQKLLGIGGKLGFFGNMTAQKVREFQQKNELKVDAIVGPETWKALHEGDV